MYKRIPAEIKNEILQKTPPTELEPARLIEGQCS